MLEVQEFRLLACNPEKLADRKFAEPRDFPLREIGVVAAISGVLRSLLVPVRCFATVLSHESQPDMAVFAGFSPFCGTRVTERVLQAPGGPRSVLAR